MNIFKEVKDAVSAKEAASFYGLKINSNGMCCCPFHDDRHPSMKVDKRFHCFGCQADGDVIDLIQKMFGLTTMEAVHKLIGDFHLDISTGRKESAHERNIRIRRIRTKEHEINVRRAYAEELRQFRLKLIDIFNTYRDWELSYSPTGTQWEEGSVDERYITAINNKESVEYILDILDFGEDEEIYEEYKHREEIIRAYERKITDAEQKSAERSGERTTPDRESERIA
jgi:hypothetical protein